MSMEYPCIYFEKDGKCRKFSDKNTTSYCVMGPCPEQKLSNASKVVKTMQESTIPYYRKRAEAAEKEVEWKNKVIEAAERRFMEAEARAEKAERERDAAISDLTYIARTYLVDLCDDLVCQYCKHYQNVNTGCPGWTENDCFEWRGKKEE